MMPVRLRDAMAETFGDWEDDLTEAWRTTLGAVASGLDAIDAELALEFWEPIFPARRNRHFPGQPKGAHALRAFDGITPGDVRCVMLGQDPYPEPGFATGRAFEAGNVENWAELDKMFSKSVRVFMQQIVAARTGNGGYARSFGDWPAARAALTDPQGAFEGPGAIADRWVEAGVLLLNASLTLSRFQVSIDPHQSRGHLKFWRPLMLKVVEAMVARGKPVVFIGLGDAAADILAASGVAEGINGTIAAIVRPHPAFAEALFAQPNPFMLCNQYLETMGAAPIAW
jgi:uracil-DNA glycosylase